MADPTTYYIVNLIYDLLVSMIIKSLLLISQYVKDRYRQIVLSDVAMRHKAHDCLSSPQKLKFSGALVKGRLSK